MNFIFSFEYFYPLLIILVMTVTGIVTIRRQGIDKQCIDFTHWDLLMTVLLLFLLVNISVSSPGGATFQDLASPVVCAVLYVCTRLFLPLAFSGVTRVIILIIIATGFIEVVIGAGQSLNVLQNSIRFFKIAGSFGNAGIYAMFLLSVLPFCIYVFLDLRKTNAVLAYLSLIVALLIACALLFYTDSRTGWLVMIVIFGAYIFAYKKIPVYALISLAVVGAFLFIFLLKYKADSTSGRSFVMMGSLRLLTAHPLTGIGVGNFDKVYNDYQALYFSSHTDIAREKLAAFIVVAYNEFLQFFLEGGVLAILITCLIAFRFTRFIKRVVAGDADNMIKLLVIAAISTVFTSMTFYPFRTMSTLTHFVIVSGLLGTADKQVLFKVNLRRLYIQGLAIVLCLFIQIKGLSLAGSVSRWQTIASYLNKKEVAPTSEEVVKLYGKVFDELRGTPVFLNDYAEKLYAAGDYPKAIQFCEQAALRSSHFNIYETMGRSYQAIGDFGKAENAFLKCNYLVPNRFYPKYSLMLLYLNQGKLDNAKQWAKVIAAMPVKVDGEDVRKIKLVAQRVIDKAQSVKGR
jgi:hypothetical protein